jgi:type IV fimbrial biogenesis protein FimT
MIFAAARSGITARPWRARSAGVTLIELLISIIVLAVLFGIGVPAFRDASLGSKLGSAASNLVASVQLARSEAIKRNRAMTLCSSTDGATCAGSANWQTGWVIRDPDGIVVQSQEAAPRTVLVTQTVGPTSLIFQPIGIGATAATFRVCRNDPVGAQERTVRISASGSPNVTITYDRSCP